MARTGDDVSARFHSRLNEEQPPAIQASNNMAEKPKNRKVGRDAPFMSGAAYAGQNPGASRAEPGGALQFKLATLCADSFK